MNKISPVTLSSYPHLVREWDNEKNEGFVVENIRHGSNMKFWWKCSECKHSWRAIVKSRARLGRGCPKCAGKHTDNLEIEYPQLSKLWDRDKNEKAPNDYTAGMNEKVWWKCKNGHEWKNSVFYMVCRKNKNYCSECLLIENSRFLSKELHYELYKEWDNVKNAGVDFKDCTKGSSIARWWVCVKNHSYQSTIPDRLRGRGCAICAGKKTVSLDKEFPTLVSDWNDKNNMSDYTSGSGYIAEWKCADGHEYAEPIQRRVRNNNCAICADRIFKPFYSNDFNLLSEWDYEKNDGLNPESLSAGSHKKVWWKCDKGHSWYGVIYAYVRGSRCSKCNASKRASKGENELYHYIQSVYNGRIVNHEQSIIYPYELDIHIPDLNLAFEFNGDYWHSDEVIRGRSGMSADEYHNMKIEMCKDQEIELFYVWESEWVKNKAESQKWIKEKILSYS